MSQEIIDKYKDDGLIGSFGEEWLFRKLKESYEKVFDYRQDLTKQYTGIDFGIQSKAWKKEYTLDCKRNLSYYNGCYYIPVEIICKTRPGWFLTSHADRIYHVSLDRRIGIWYDLDEMRMFLFSSLLGGFPDLSFSKELREDSDIKLLEMPDQSLVVSLKVQKPEIKSKVRLIQ